MNQHTHEALALARAKYEKARSLANAEYEGVDHPAHVKWVILRDAAQIKYNEGRGPSREEHEAYVNLLWTAYQEVHAPAYAQYEKALNLALAEYEDALVAYRVTV